MEKEGYWSDFECPKCGSHMFGTFIKNGETYRGCHGNEKWVCDYSAPLSQDCNHFKKFVRYDGSDLQEAASDMQPKGNNMKQLTEELKNHYLTLAKTKVEQDRLKINKFFKENNIKPLLKPESSIDFDEGVYRIAAEMWENDGYESVVGEYVKINANEEKFTNRILGF